MPSYLSAPLLRLLLATVMSCATAVSVASENARTAAAPGATDPLPVSADPTELALWAQRHEHGEGVERDYDRALRMYCAAAALDHIPAQTALGWMYANGRGVNRDDDLAAAWFRRAARGGDKLSAGLLERMASTNPGRAAECIRPNGQAWWPVPPSEKNPDQATIKRWVAHFAPKFDLDAALVLAVIEAESNFNAQARSHRNAQGLMQLIPATAKRFGVSDTFDPVENIQGGMAYLQWLLTHFKGNVEFALAGYNAGERAVERYSGVPPYPETRAYVRRVLKALKRSS